MSVGKKLNKKDLLSTNLATKNGYCTQRLAIWQVADYGVKANRTATMPMREMPMKYAQNQPFAILRVTNWRILTQNV